MNQNGMIAGWYSDSGGVAHSFVRSTSGQITELDPPGLTNSFAVSINLKGQIVGFAARTIDHASHTHSCAAQTGSLRESTSLAHPISRPNPSMMTLRSRDQ
jgi:hypothetical protein